ncbi:MAG: DNA replication and repair protein RecF [Bacteroidota bacterium]
MNFKLKARIFSPFTHAKRLPLFLHRLNLTQFRNYSELSLEFGPGINCLTGPNGAGKSNILDAIHYLAFTRGFRSSQDQQVVQQGEQFFFNQGQFIREKVPELVACNFIKGKGKKVLVNKVPLGRLSEHIGHVPLVAILPGDTDLINGASADRRRFLDMLISQYDRGYLQHLIQHDRLLSQRNAQLRLFGEQGGFVAEDLAIWDQQIIPHGIAIQAERRAFLEKFQGIFDRFFHEIVSSQEKPHIRYRSHIEENTAEGWEALWAKQLDKDRVNQYTSTGIHRDDLVFYINDRAVKNYGSQGQQKTFVIALKLAQYELLAQQTGQAPLLLLDDLFDKLDQQRLARIAHMLDQDIPGQIFITDTSQEKLEEIFAASSEREVRYYAVKSGEVEAGSESGELAEDTSPRG